MQKEKMYSFNASTGEIIWEGFSSTEQDIMCSVENAKRAQIAWAKTPLQYRKDIILKFASCVQEHADEAAKIISDENGKPFWESKTEVKSLINKVQVVFDAYEERAKEKIKEMASGKHSVTRYIPHGVLAVLGPFNFPMSMPNSHVMPALYAGNAIVFKPSEKSPMAATFYKKLWDMAGLPEGLLQIVYGDYRVGELLTSHNDISGALFIGSRKAGKAIEKKMIDQDKICAVEMGGNSPLVVWDYDNIRAAINIVIQSAYITTGQRCSAARRLIVNEKIYDEFLSLFSKAVGKIVVGRPYDDPQPFIGPMIDEHAANVFFEQYNALVNNGAKEIVSARRLDHLGKAFISPSVLEVNSSCERDEEIFGPLLQVYKASSIDEAIHIANNTRYGLAAGIITASKNTYDLFLNSVKAGIINWNQSLTGSTTIAPFGGVKGSGNYRPAGYLSVDYCLYSCASIEVDKLVEPEKLSPGLNF